MTSVLATREAALEASEPDHQPTTHRRGLHLKFFDVACWVVAVLGVYLIHHGFTLSPMQGLMLLLLVMVSGLAQLIFGWGFFLYRQRYTTGSFDEVRALWKSGLATGGVLVIAGIITGFFGEHPPAVGVVVVPAAVIMMFGVRYAERQRRLAQSLPARNAQRTLVIGAGDAGIRLIEQLLDTKGSKHWPVGMVDDDPTKRHVQVRDVKVLGTLSELHELIPQTRAQVLAVAIARPPKGLVQGIQNLADEHNIQVKIIPPLEELLDRDITPTDLRDVSIYDLLGREPVETNVAEIAGYLNGSRVLVTGAGGSIGSILCQHISQFRPEELIMVDRDETALQHTQLLINGNGLLSTKETVLADIRDADTIRQVFEEYRPDVVFHAAALKHLPMLERFPEEGWKTNVLGTQNVLEAAAAVNVERFVNISTDKAANPTSQLGYSKRSAERLTAWMGQQTGRRYLSVRFGNVIGSRGSMLPTFTKLIEQGGPLTVTHPDVTRYFMTIPEACQLVLQAGGIGSSGEVLILDMGEPVRILDVAKRMIAMSGRDVEIVYTGLREGEKLHEELTSDSEETLASPHPLISRTTIEPVPVAELNYLASKTKVQS